MLYVTTRNDRDTFTSSRAMTEDRAEDGGFYVPLRMPVFSPDEVRNLASVPFGGRIAEILNRLFQTKLTRWDIDFCIGRNAIKLVPLRNRIIVGEFWHNPQWHYQKTENSLSKLLCKEDVQPGSWLKIAVRIAMISAVSLELYHDGTENVDFSMVSGDFLWPISAWYARQWGMPVGDMILCCNENKSIWDLICHGQLRTEAVSLNTMIPEADIVLPPEIERLIYGCAGLQETQRYLDCCRKGMPYYAESQILSELQKGNYVSVVSSERIRDLIPGALRTHQYLLAPGSALAYGGLMDYRAKKGSRRAAVVISENGPQTNLDEIASILGIPEQELRKHF